MNVLLVNCPNRLTRRPEFFPYGLGILVSQLRGEGIDAEIYDTNLHRDLETFRTYLSTHEPWDVVGFSGLVTTYGIQRQLAAIVRTYSSDSLLISGGGLATSIPELLVSKTEIEVACVGEGESILPSLMHEWGTMHDLSRVAGIVWRKRHSREIVRTRPATPVSDLDEVPFPDWEKAGLPRYFEYSGFYAKGIRGSRLRRRADLTTTRGCPYECSFCFNVYRRRSIRCRSIENVMSEIVLLKERYDIDGVDFLDENFCFSKARVEKLCHSLIRAGLGIVWGTAARVTDVDAALLKLMRQAGCIFILYGFESGSQTMLDRMHKGITVDSAWQAFKLTEEAGIDARGNLIIGHPGETKETLSESLDFQVRRRNFLKTLHADHLFDDDFRDDLKKRFSTVSFCTPYPGTEIYGENAKRIGELEPFMESITLRDAKELVVNLTDLSDEELLSAQQKLAISDTNDIGS